MTQGEELFVVSTTLNLFYKVFSPCAETERVTFIKNFNLFWLYTKKRTQILCFFFSLAKGIV